MSGLQGTVLCASCMQGYAGAGTLLLVCDSWPGTAGEPFCASCDHDLREDGLIQL